MGIRIIESRDVKLIARLNHDVQELHAEIEPDIFKNYSMIEMQRLFQESLANQNTYSYIAYYCDEPAGYIVFTLFEFPESPLRKSIKVVYIDQICVSSNYRGMNIGKNLIEKVRLIAREKGIHRIELEYWHKNENAGGFFRSLGFETFNERMFLRI